MLKRQARLSPEETAYYAQIYSNYHKMMFSIARKYTDEHSMAEDVVSNSNLALMGKITVLKGLDPKQITAYIATTVKNTAINHRRNIIRRQELFQPEVHLKQDGACENDILHQMEKREEYRELLQMMRKLTKNERMVLYMRFCLNCSTREVAETFGLSESSIRTYVYVSKKKIRRMRENETTAG